MLGFEHMLQDYIWVNICVCVFIYTSVYWYYPDATHSNDRNWRGTKEPLDEGERGEWKSCLKTKY